jgi:Zn-dependent protease with chaperone function
LYRFSLVVVSLAMVLLPVIYVGLVGLFVYGIWRYAIGSFAVMRSADYGPLWYIAFLLFLGPIIIGGLMTFFLFKPFFAPRREQEKPFSLNHADAPQLFALVGWICRSLEAPIPSRIDVNCKVDAAAGFRGGWRSLFGNDIRLVIGLPLAAGMNVSQFASIIAHEYGHFSQGSAMRAYYVITAINAWFFRVVYERDKWDIGLELASERDDQGLFSALVLYLARFAIWLTRQAFWLLMAAGLALSCFMSRQMEFDADRYEAFLGGSEMFVETTRRARQLNLGSDAAIRQIREKWKKERKLFDQIPELIVSRANEITAEEQEKLHTLLSRRRTRLWDTHPSDVERIEHALAAREPGILDCTMPGKRLFADFAELSRRVTLNYYQSVFGREIPAEKLISTQQIAASTEHDYAADVARIETYLHGIVNELVPVFITENKALLVPSAETTLSELVNSRRRMEELSAEAASRLAELQHWDRQSLLAAQAAQLLQAGFQFDPAEFGLFENDIETAQAGARSALESAKTSLQPFQCAAKTRLAGAIQLLRLPHCAAQIPGAPKLQEEAQAMIWVLSRLEPVFEPLLDLRRLSATMQALLVNRTRQPAAENVRPVLENLCMEIQERVNLIQEKTSQIRYPFLHAKEQLMVNEYARSKDYHSDASESALGEAQSHTDKLFKLHTRLLANLVVIAEEVEARLAPNA